MALLTRPRRTGDPTAEAIEKAREVSEQVADRAREVGGEALDLAGEAAGRARVAAEPHLARAREATEPAVARAREASEPALAQVRSVVGTVLRLVVRLVALLPGIGAQVLETIASVLGTLADRSAEAAHVPPPSRVGRRRRAALWFVGGFASGAAAGYAVARATAHDHHDHAVDAPWQPTAVPDADADHRPASSAEG